MIDAKEIEKKLEEWNALTQFAMLLQKEGLKAKLNDLTVTKQLENLSYSKEEIKALGF